MREDIIDAIRDCYLFAGADARSIRTLADGSYVKRIPAGAPLFFKGDDEDGLHVVLSGLVRIWLADTEGRELTLTLREPGEPFGEIALLDGLPRSANASALEDSECLVTPRRALDTVLQHDIGLARHLIQLLCELLRRDTDTLGGFAFVSLDRRLARKLHDLALSHATLNGDGAVFLRKFSQTDLAQMLGVTREAVNKRLAAMAQDRVVTQENGLFVIPDLAALAARAAGAPDGR